jgi:hypothetical protein
MIVRRFNVAILAAIAGLLESVLILRAWTGADISDWNKTPLLARLTAPIPYLMGQPESFRSFCVAWTLNTVLWSGIAYFILMIALRRHPREARLR